MAFWLLNPFNPEKWHAYVTAEGYSCSIQLQLAVLRLDALRSNLLL